MNPTAININRAVVCNIPYVGGCRWVGKLKDCDVSTHNIPVDCINGVLLERRIDSYRCPKCGVLLYTNSYNVR